MLNSLLTKIFGSRNERTVRNLRKQVVKINVLEPEFEALSEDALRGKTAEFRERLEKGESLDQLLPEAFAAVRESARRNMGLRHYDVQLIGGMVLHQGRISEMRTGEGKTLVATLPVYLNALPAKGVHVVTVNDYLARRDSNWMAPVYEGLGMTVGVIVPGQKYDEKRAAYGCDIAYGTNNEFGFDHLRSNMAFTANERLQRPLHFAIIDEVDSILIDEARTPLIISGPSEDSPDLYLRIDRVAPELTAQADEESEGDFWVDEKQKQVHLSEDGMHHAEEVLLRAGVIKEGESLYDPQNLAVVHHLNAALRANHLYKRDVAYIVRDGEVVIVDEFTGRTLAGRRWSDGLHQAVEAKEGVPVQRDNQTLASITFQNYFRMYDKLSGMTGTADTEASEFQSIYGLEVVVIPTHRPMIRNDMTDLVFLSQAEKFQAILEDIRDCQTRGQPVLVGTTSIETSELIAKELKTNKIPHEVLNAKQHEREAHVVAQAGSPGAVTIATNMAGRGTDIVLGGNFDAELAEHPADLAESDREALKAAWTERHQAVLDSGGLHIIGTERHESRRIDNQLRGRSGRQGDPGSSRFYLSFDDSLMRIFANDRLRALMTRLGMQPGEAIEHPLVNRAIENAQRKVEAHNFDIRKNLLDYDDVANDQRRVLYEQRNDLLDSDDIGETVATIREDVIIQLCAGFASPGTIDEQWDVDGLRRTLQDDYGIAIDPKQWTDENDDLSAEGLARKVCEATDEHATEREEQVGKDNMRQAERAIMLSVLDSQWKDHLARMDYLRQGIHLRGFAQKQPKQEFKREAFALFQEMLENIKRETVTILSRVRIRSEEDVAAAEKRTPAPMDFQHAEASGFGTPPPAGETSAPAAMPMPAPATVARDAPKVGRNDPCPCGSGKKYKQCHGRLS